MRPHYVALGVTKSLGPPGIFTQGRIIPNFPTATRPKTTQQKRDRPRWTKFREEIEARQNLFQPFGKLGFMTVAFNLFSVPFEREWGLLSQKLYQKLHFHSNSLPRDISVIPHMSKHWIQALVLQMKPNSQTLFPHLKTRFSSPRGGRRREPFQRLQIQFFFKKKKTAATELFRQLKIVLPPKHKIPGVSLKRFKAFYKMILGAMSNLCWVISGQKFFLLGWSDHIFQRLNWVLFSVQKNIRQKIKIKIT